MTLKATSPSQTALSESQLHKKGLCDYVVNVADGCSHGCAFCYVPSMPMIWGDPGEKFADAGIEDPQDEWGEYALYRDAVVENTARDCQRLLPDDWRCTRRGRGLVGISFGTDCYMDPRAGELTKGVVGVLTGHEPTLDGLPDGVDPGTDENPRPVRILTRNPKLLADLHGEFYRDLPLDAVTIGSSIPSLNQAEVSAIEGRAPPVRHRLDGLREGLDE
jgi:DNA repair photolyase